MKPTAMQLRHYGSSSFDRSEFEPIKDRMFIKPYGGLWTSPVDSKYGWKDWCEAEDFAHFTPDNFFDVDFNGRVLVINTVRDLDKLEWETYPPKLGCFRWPKFEPLLERFDAIHLTVAGQERTRFSRPRSFYGWDCETVLVMNPECIS